MTEAGTRSAGVGEDQLGTVERVHRNAVTHHRVADRVEVPAPAAHYDWLLASWSRDLVKLMRGLLCAGRPYRLRNSAAMLALLPSNKPRSGETRLGTIADCSSS